MKFFDDQKKNVRWWNRNMCFLATIIVVAVNFGIFYLVGSDWNAKPVITNWNDMLSFSNLVNNFLSAFDHLSLEQLILNMVCFFMTGIYLERRIGTINLLLMVILFAFIGENIVGANHFGGWSVGFSCVNYALYGYTIIDFIFMLRRESRSVANIIYGIFMLIFIYVACCYKAGGIYPFTLELDYLPIDLMYNMGHYTGAIVGFILGTIIKVSKLQAISANER